MNINEHLNAIEEKFRLNFPNRSGNVKCGEGKVRWNRKNITYTQAGDICEPLDYGVRWDIHAAYDILGQKFLHALNDLKKELQKPLPPNPDLPLIMEIMKGL